MILTLTFALFKLNLQDGFPENLLINLVYPAWKETPHSFWTGKAKAWKIFVM